MADFNKVILVGNLTRDPEMRHTSSGAGVCTLGMAINRKFTSQGETREETCFVDISVWGRQGESCTEYLRKGRSVLVEGRLKLDQWDDRETGKKRSRLSVVAERVQFLSSPQRDGGYEDGPPRGDDSGGGWQSRQQAPSRQQYDSGSQQQRPPPQQQQQQAPPPFPVGDAPPQQQQQDKRAFDVDDESIDDIPF